MRRYRIKITSGQYAGRYVGPNFSDGLVTSPEHIASRDVGIPALSIPYTSNCVPPQNICQGLPTGCKNN